MKDIEQAPRIFREQLLALKKAGALDDPAFKQAVLDAAKEVMAEQSTFGAEEPCSKSSLNSARVKVSLSEHSARFRDSDYSVQKH